MMDMEYSVCRRENIQNRTKASTAPTKGNFIKKIQDIKRSIRQLKSGIMQGFYYLHITFNFLISSLKFRPSIT